MCPRARREPRVCRGTLRCPRVRSRSTAACQIGPPRGEEVVWVRDDENGVVPPMTTCVTLFDYQDVCGGGGIRTPGACARRFSRPLPSTARPSLRRPSVYPRSDERWRPSATGWQPVSWITPRRCRSRVASPPGAAVRRRSQAARAAGARTGTRVMRGAARRACAPAPGRARARGPARSARAR